MTDWGAKPVYFDLTQEITETLDVFPGDPVFGCKQISAINPEEAGSFNLCELHMGNHIGTHIDFPSHVLPGGKTSSDYPLSKLIGQGCIIKVPAITDEISADFIKKSPIKPNDIVFFKTKSSNTANHVSLGMSAAIALVEKGVMIVGIDQMSIDAADAQTLPVHRYLLSNNVLIVEGLNLMEVNEERGEIIIAPLKIADIDGVPARVLVRIE